MSLLALRLGLTLGAVGLAIVAFAYVQHLRHDNAALRVSLASAEAQASINQTAGQITERTITHEVVVTRQAEEAVHAVQALPGASAPLDPAFRDGLRARLDGLREPLGGDPGPHPGGPVAALPPADP